MEHILHHLALRAVESPLGVAGNEVRRTWRYSYATEQRQLSQSVNSSVSVRSAENQLSIKHFPLAFQNGHNRGSAGRSHPQPPHFLSRTSCPGTPQADPPDHNVGEEWPAQQLSVSVLAKCQQQGWRVDMDEPVGNTLRLSSESYGC